MKSGSRAAALVVSGVLVGAVSACGSADPAVGPAEIDAESRITAPPGFDAESGWEYKPAWMPGLEPLPVATSTSGQIAHLDQTQEGYVLRVREAASGDEVWSSTPWKAPDLTKSQLAGDPESWDSDRPMTVPRVMRITSGGQEYFAVLAYGEKRADQLHEAEEGVSVSFYPAASSGDSVAPVSSADLTEASESTDLRSTPTGLLAQADATSWLVDPATGKTTETPAASEEWEDDPVFPTSKGLVHKGRSGGFGIPGGWRSDQVAPPGVPATLGDPSEETWFSTAPETDYNGDISGAVEGHLLAKWTNPDTNDVITAVHDAETGRVEATAPCDVSAVWGVDFQVPESVTSDLTPALSPNGQYLVAEGALFDLKSGKGFCSDSDEKAKEINLISVGDDGTAYGWAEGDDDDSPKTPVSVTAQGSTALPPETRIPAAVLGDTGVFASDPGQDAAGLVVISKNG
ncbi:hypothetical protein [Saccharopolyspora sp. NPDC002686]|uniref:hypothetical protein n=1 Tax=Saccharopolyspora sp. NPDC002686 TaxID=3154541 RepID=UPI00332BDB09